MVACYQAYRDVGEREWKLLHSVYAFVEDRGVAGSEVAHPAHKGRQTTCAETYAQVLLIDLANPGKLTPRQTELISLWLERWTPKVSIGRAPVAAGDGVAPLVIDLSGAAGASRRTPEGDTTRILDIHELGSSVRKRVGLLRKGETPAALGLGEDVSASGLRLARVDPAASSRLMLGQLLGIRLADAKAFLLCAVKWLSVSVEFELRAGVHILPGIPQGAAIRAVGAPAAEQHIPAFLLPALAALQTPETLVVPAGWFKPNREIEVLAERSGKLRLASVVDRGADFERVTFEAL